MLITNSSRTAGMVYLQYRFQEMGWPSWGGQGHPGHVGRSPYGGGNAPDVRALGHRPGKAVQVHAQVLDRESRTGTITVAMGMLSTKADAMAVNQMRTMTIISGCPRPGRPGKWPGRPAPPSAPSR